MLILNDSDIFCSIILIEPARRPFCCSSPRGSMGPMHEAQSGIRSGAEEVNHAVV